MKKEIKNLFTKAKFVTGVNLAALLFSGTVSAKNLSDKECQEKFDGKLLAFNTESATDKGCECDNVYTLFDQTTGNINFVQGNCRAIKPLSTKECKEQFDGKISDRAFPEDKGCTCDNVADVIDAEAENIYHSILGNCRAMTAKEKAFLDLINHQDYDCIGECQEGQKLIDCIKDKNCKTLANKKCANVEAPNADNGLSYEEYYEILNKAKKCQAPADKLIKQTIKSQGR